jgi:hypothetical protein
MNETDLSSTRRLIGTYTLGAKDTLRLSAQGPFLRAEASCGTNDVRHGMAASFAGRLVIAFGPKDKVEIGAYRVSGNSMEGVWVPPAADDLTKCGREKSAGGKDGVWTITEAIAIDNTAYTGTVHVKPIQGVDATKRPTPVEIEWRLHDGNYRSFGFACDDAMYTTFSFEPEKPYCLAVFDPRADGGFEGMWMTNEFKRGGTSLARRR